MPLRLSDLLDRLRPAGAPGAPAEGESRRDEALTDEIAALAAELVELNAEADKIVARAHREADQIIGDGERRARRLRGELADRVAAASNAPVEDEGYEVDERLAKLADETQRTIAAHRSALDARSDALVATAVDMIWQIVEPLAEVDT